MRVGVSDAQVVGPTAVLRRDPGRPGHRRRDPERARRRRLLRLRPAQHRPRAARRLAAAGRVGARRRTSATRSRARPSASLDYDFSNFQLELTSAPTVSRRRCSARSPRARAATSSRSPRSTWRTSRPATRRRSSTGWPGQIVTNLRSPGHRRARGDPGQQRRHQRRHRRQRPDGEQAGRGHPAAGGPAYKSRWIDPVDGADGGQPGGNIRQVFLFRTDRGLGFVDRAGRRRDDHHRRSCRQGHQGAPVGLARAASTRPTRRGPASRKPLVGEFTWHGRPSSSIANHFNSKGGDDPLFGRFQPPVRVQRGAAAPAGRARCARSWTDPAAATPSAKVIVLGDINDFEFSQTRRHPGRARQPTRLVDLPRTLPASERYSYVFEGNSQVLDHILVSGSLANGPSGRRTSTTSCTPTRSSSTRTATTTRRSCGWGSARQGLTATGRETGKRCAPGGNDRPARAVVPIVTWFHRLFERRSR